MAFGIKAGSKTKSTISVAMACAGILLNSVVSGFLAIIIPPASLMAIIPSVPSDPKPERMTPIAFFPQLAASELKNVLIVKCGPFILLLSVR